MRFLSLAALCAASCLAAAQQPAAAPAPDDAGDKAPVTELDAVRVTAPRPDPFAFRNPIEVDGTRFGRDWRETPSAEEIGMQGGIVMLGINYAIAKTGKAITRLPGWKQQVAPATARPPPLDPALQARAARLHREDADGGAPDPEH